MLHCRLAPFVEDGTLHRLLLFDKASLRSKHPAATALQRHVNEATNLSAGPLNRMSCGSHGKNLVDYKIFASSILIMSKRNGPLSGMDAAKKEALAKALRENNWNIAAAAKCLGICKITVRTLAVRFGLMKKQRAPWARLVKA